MSEPDVDPAARLEATLVAALERLEQARPFAKGRPRTAVLDVAGRLFAAPGGIARLHALAPRLDAAGLFAGSDWDRPQALLPRLVGTTLQGPDAAVVALEAVSLLRLLAIATGGATHPEVHAERARHFLTQVLALNIRRFFGTVDEAARARQGPREAAVDALFRYLAEHVGFDDVLGALVEEIWRVLSQRPIQVAPIKEMITQIAITLSERGGDLGDARLGADRLISALFGPTEGCLDDPGLAIYRERLAAMDEAGLHQEAQGFSRAMHDTGLVSDYHADFAVWAVEEGSAALIPEALGLSSAGRESWRRHEDLAITLVRAAVRPETAQALYGLALLLERGVLSHSPIAPALRRQIALEPSEAAARSLAFAFGPDVPAGAALLAGVLQVMGQPLGVGQGANPSCQSARAISMWALNDPDFLLHLVAQAARMDTVLMHFEGRPINSADLPFGLLAGAPLDADPVSIVLVPHLDRIYAEMGRMCAGRGEDPHRWINPEFHGWWVGRDCVVAVDVATGALPEFEGFLERFHAAYHPEFNGDQPVIHPQPAGIAVTDSTARFVGWHAIAILRVAADQTGTMRVYFYNPNNDSGQDWGAGVVVSTRGKGERYGEASLPFGEFASRLYLFHDDPVKPAPVAWSAPPEVAGIAAMARESWAAGRPDPADLQGAAAAEAG